MKKLNLILGASEEAVIDWMRQPKNKKTLEYEILPKR